MLLRLRSPPPVRVIKKWEVERSGRVWDKRTGDIVVGVPNGSGILMVKHEPLHRIVALAWVKGRTPGKNCVRHIDGNCLNNAASNLEWCSSLGPVRRARKRRPPSYTIAKWLTNN